MRFRGRLPGLARRNGRAAKLKISFDERANLVSVPSQHVEPRGGNFLRQTSQFDDLLAWRKVHEQADDAGAGD